MKQFSAKRIIFSIAGTLWFAPQFHAQGTAINDTGNAPDPSAILDISSTSKGLLIPRMTTAQRDAIAAPAEGLQVFNTDTKCFEFFAYGVWQTQNCAILPPASCAGELIASFGSGGYITENPSAGENYIYTMAIDGTGVYAAGIDEAPSMGNAEWRVQKRDLNSGVILWTQVEDASTGYEEIYAMDAGGSGVYLGGFSEGTGWKVQKRDATDGSVIWSQSVQYGSNSWVSGISWQSDGVYIGGADDISVPQQWRMEKRDPATGALIWTQISNPSANSDQVYAIATDATGVYVAGDDYMDNDAAWRIEKRDLSTGDLIWMQRENPSATEDKIHAIAVDATGIYLAGFDNTTEYPQWRIQKRSISDGTVIWSETVVDPSSYDFAQAIRVDGSALYVAGYASPGDQEWRVQKRNSTTGALIWSQESNPSPSGDIILGMVIDNSGLYTGGLDYSDGNPQWRIEKRCR